MSSGSGLSQDNSRSLSAISTYADGSFSIFRQFSSSEFHHPFEKDIFSYISKRLIAELKLGLLEALRKIEKRGALEKMRKVLLRCGEVFRYAIVTGRAEYNPIPDLTSALTIPKKIHFPFLAASGLSYFLNDPAGYTGSSIHSYLLAEMIHASHQQKSVNQVIERLGYRETGL